MTQIVRVMVHPQNSYRDLDFLVESSVTSLDSIPKVFVYCDDVKNGSNITDHLNEHVPEGF